MAFLFSSTGHLFGFPPLLFYDSFDSGWARLLLRHISPDLYLVPSEIGKIVWAVSFIINDNIFSRKKKVLCCIPNKFIPFILALLNVVVACLYHLMQALLTGKIIAAISGSFIPLLLNVATCKQIIAAS